MTKESENAGIVSGVIQEHEGARFAGFAPDSDMGALFSQAWIKENSRTYQAGLRGETHSRYGEFLTGSVGFSQAMKETLFSTRFSRGYKAPSVYQLFAPEFMGVPVGNSDLEPETSRSFEASLQRKTDRYLIGSIYFRNDLRNLIQYADGFQNRGGYRVEGVEHKSEFLGEMGKASLSHTIQDFSYEEEKVLRRPQHFTQFQGAYFFSETYEAYGKVRWFGARKDEDSGNVTKLNPYEVVDLGVRANWGATEMNLQLQNILDREYEDIYGFSVQPRSFFTSFIQKF